jgi:acyl-coenzyme A synthetase/AMP-(fatty) acid ligase
VAGKARRETHHAVVHAAAVAGADRDGGGVVAVFLVSNERGNKVLAHRDTVLNDVHEALAQRAHVEREVPEK